MHSWKTASLLTAVLLTSCATDMRRTRARTWIKRAELELSRLEASEGPTGSIVDTRVWIANLHAEAGDTNRALATVRRIASCPARAETYAWVALAQARNGNKTGALQTLELAEKEAATYQDDDGRAMLAAQIVAARALAGDPEGAGSRAPFMNIENPGGLRDLKRAANPAGAIPNTLLQVFVFDKALAGEFAAAKRLAGNLKRDAEIALGFIAANQRWRGDEKAANETWRRAGMNPPERNRVPDHPDLSPTVASCIAKGDVAGASKAIDALVTVRARSLAYVLLAQWQAENGDLAGAAATCKLAIAAGANIFLGFPADFTFTRTGPGVLRLLMDAEEYELAFTGAAQMRTRLCRSHTYQYLGAEMIRRGREDRLEKFLASIEDHYNRCHLCTGAAAGHIGVSNLRRGRVYHELPAKP